MRLYDLAEQYQDLLDLMESGEEIAGFKEMLDGLAGQIEDKADNVAKMIRALEGQARLLHEESNRLLGRAAAIENNTKGLKRYLEEQLAKVKDRKLKSPMFSMWIQKNTPGLNIVNMALVPEQYFKQPPAVPDNARMIEELKAGKKIPGVELKQTESIRIR